MTELVIDYSALANNAAAIRRIAGTAKVIGMVKSNGYGLGLKCMAGILAENGVDMLAVTTLEDALELRESGITLPILLVTPLYTQEQLSEAVQHDIILTVASADSAAAAQQAAKAADAAVHVHIALDTGFGRFGFLPEQTDLIIQAVKACDALDFCGIFTHLYDAGAKDEAASRRQYELFMQVCNKLEGAGINPGMRHIANSAAALRFDWARLDAVRCGSAFLGRVAVPGGCKLERVGVLRSQITDIYEKPAGHNYGYGGVCSSRAALRTAVIPVGTEHGLCVQQADNSVRIIDRVRRLWHCVRELKSPPLGFVTVNGTQCRVLGQAGLCSSIIDVTGVDCSRGDEVTVNVNTLRVGSHIPRVIIRN